MATKKTKLQSSSAKSAGSTTKKRTQTKTTKDSSEATSRSNVQPVKNTRFISKKDDIKRDVIMWATLAVCLIVFLGNLRIGGKVLTSISDFFFGIMGVLEYVFPVAVFFGVLFALSNRGRVEAVVRIVAAVFFAIGLCMFFELIIGVDTDNLGAINSWHNSFETHWGGGIIGGLYTMLVVPGFGKAAAYIIAIAIIIISFVVVSGLTPFKFVSNKTSKAYENAKEKGTSWWEKREERRLERDARRAEREAQLEEDRLARESFDEDQELNQEENRRRRIDNQVRGVTSDTVLKPGELDLSGLNSEPDQIVELKPDSELLKLRREKMSQVRPPEPVAETETTVSTAPVEKINDKTKGVRANSSNVVVLDPLKTEETSGDVSEIDGASEIDEVLESVASNMASEVKDSQHEFFSDTFKEKLKSHKEKATSFDDSMLVTPDITGMTSPAPVAAATATTVATTATTVSTTATAVSSTVADAVMVETDDTNKADAFVTKANSYDDELNSREDILDANAGIKSEPDIFDEDEDADMKIAPDRGRSPVKNPTSSIEEQLEAIDQVEEEIAKAEEEPKKPYVFPTADLLTPSKKGQAKDNSAEIENTAVALQQTLKNFGVNVTIEDVTVGPTVTRFEIKPEVGTKVSKIVNLTDDLKLNLAAKDIRIEAPIPGKAAIGIEIPNKESTPVMFRDLVESEEFINHKSKISFGAGMDIEGNVIMADIAKMPHLLIAGATGSGKSVCINTIIMSIIYRADPEEVKLIMIDPKMVELKMYNDIPHLYIPVVTDAKKAAGALNWAVTEMMDRYERFSNYGVRNLAGFNEKIEEAQKLAPDDKTLKKLPQIVIIVDEFADLMMVAPGEVEDAVCRIAQLARACGIHLILATQRPTANVITGLIKANIPSRIAFSVASGMDSRIVIDQPGAERLLGHGDMLYYPYGATTPIRAQGSFVSDEDAEKVVEFIKENYGKVSYDSSINEKIEAASVAKEKINSAQAEMGSDDGRDDFFEQAAYFIMEKEKASIGMLQRKFKVGFNRAARIMDQLAEAGVVGPEVGTKPRDILMGPEQFAQYMEENL